MNTNETEYSLLIKARNGSKEAYGEIVKIYMRRAYFSALTFLGSHDDALDISQEAFIRTYRSIKKFDVNKKFFTWYYQILKNLCLNHLRNKSRQAVNFSNVYEILENTKDDEQDVEIMAEKNETKKIVWEALWKLSPEDREIITAKDIVNASYEEIAELLQIPTGTVMSRLYNARKKLRKIIEEMK